MKVNIQAPEGVDKSIIEETLMFYLGRVDLAVSSLEFDLEEHRSASGESSFWLHLNTHLNDGEELEFEETQGDPRLALQRLMDRLQRRLQRRNLAHAIGQ